MTWIVAVLVLLLPGNAAAVVVAFVDGTLLSVQGYELKGDLVVMTSLSLNWVDLPEGSFTRRLVSTRLNYTFTPRMYISSLIQYNSGSDSLSSSVRFRWEYEPGSDLFVVYSEGRDELSGGPFLANRTFAVKFTKLFRF